MAQQVSVRHTLLKASQAMHQQVWSRLHLATFAMTCAHKPGCRTMLLNMLVPRRHAVLKAQDLPRMSGMHDHISARDSGQRKLDKPSSQLPSLSQRSVIVCN